MRAPILTSLEIHRFRGFQELSIKHLGRVNLIVGKNNVGKSSLLEALQLYARRASPTIVWQILGTRDENKRQRPGRSSNFEEALTSSKYLFYGRKEIKAPMQPIEIGPIDSIEDKLFFNIRWFTRALNTEGGSFSQPVLFEDHELTEASTPRFTVQMGMQREYNYPIEPVNAARVFRSDLKEITNSSIDANGLSRNQVGALWDSIALTSREKEVLAALRIIAPGVEDISIVGDPIPTRDRVTIVKVAGIDEPLPIRSLGDGMQRMLGIALALVNAEDGMFLVDEIENGLHYSVQPDLWRLIFQLARRLNVQIFATTHSWDCIKSFQSITQEDEKAEGVLIRLEFKDGEISATTFDEQELAIATRNQIEVR